MYCITPINRPVGAQHGESDLAPLLKWLTRYSGWLEDRARLNRFRTTFLYAVTLKGSTAAERIRRQAELNLNPPSPGSLLVKDDSETWETLAPKLESSDANEDGLAIKKMIAAGGGHTTAFSGRTGKFHPHHSRKRRRTNIPSL